MYIHTFGAYFGLATTFIASHKDASNHKNNRTSYLTDIFSVLGTIFLWLFWPSFNAAMAPIPSQQQRIVVNTVLSLTASCFVAFCWSKMIYEGRFGMVEVQNSTLAGGVAIGASADLLLYPWGAMLIGFVAGTISTFGFKYCTPYLERKIGLHDTAGIHNLHGMPGVIGGLASVFSSLLATERLYGNSLGVIFPMRAPANATVAAGLGLSAGNGRDEYMQAGFQAAALLVSIGSGLTGGLITGIILKLPCFEQLDTIYFYSDEKYWHVPDGFPTEKVIEQKHKHKKNKLSSSSDSSDEIPLPLVDMRIVDRSRPADGGFKVDNLSSNNVEKI